MPCVVLTSEDRRALATMVEGDPATEITIDLEKLEVRAGGRNFSCHMADSARQSLRAGAWDPLAELLEGADEVDKVAASLPYVD
jgi:3-isopropylmalate/(R)-2-methylmalate dehydratase small subunit